MFISGSRVLVAAALALAGWIAPAQAQAPQPTSGAQFQCDDGGKMFLSFAETGAQTGVSAVVWVRGAVYQLANLPPQQGIARIVWSDGEHSLTWSPGVQLMWMDASTHLMCGRGGHKH
ncbi:MAG: hypothetical protein QM773_03100 [Hyphomonadaceae bacterium]